MLRWLQKLLPGDRGRAPGAAPAATTAIDEVFQVVAPDALEAEGAPPLDFRAVLSDVNGLPVPDWRAVGDWIMSMPDTATQADAWARAELAWLAHLQAALGPHYHLSRHEYALMLSPLEPRVAAATVRFMTTTLTRIGRLLDGVARKPEWGSDILIVFEDEDTYYRYVSRYHPEDGEFAFSGGMHIDFGCSHFVTVEAALHAIEPVVAHEMTHACLRHLPIPAWLNEGIAVNTERRLSPSGAPPYTPAQLHWMHRRFWNETTIQEFWSGASFLRPDDGNLLSYELGRILVEQLSRDWDGFAAFVNQARLDDAGQAAAATAFGIDLGRAVTALFEVDTTASWSPDPARWAAEPERGAFRGGA